MMADSPFEDGRGTAPPAATTTTTTTTTRLDPASTLNSSNNKNYRVNLNDIHDTKGLSPSSPPLRLCSTVPDRMPHDSDLPYSQRMMGNLPQHPSQQQQQQQQHALISNLYHMRQKGTRMAPFAGRLGGNQSYVVDRSNPENADLLKKVPDAAPNLNFKEAFDWRGFTELDLYKAAVIEGIGMCLASLPVSYFCCLLLSVPHTSSVHGWETSLFTFDSCFLPSIHLSVPRQSGLANRQ